MAREPILIIGATGQQGGAVARELLHQERAVRAFTRTPGSPAARQLAEQGAEIVRGDLDDPAALRSAMEGAAGVFSVQTFTGPEGPAGETRQGIAVADAATEAGVAHLVYSSVDGAERRSGIPHFESKWQVEQHLQKLDLAATVLRPTTFIDNFSTVMRPQLIDATLVLRLPLRPTTRLQMVAVADIGAIAAKAFASPEVYSGATIALAGDELTGPEIAGALAEATGIPARFEEQPLEQVRAYSEDLARMFEWLDEHGYQADIQTLRRQHPGLRSLRDWLAETRWQPADAVAT